MEWVAIFLLRGNLPNPGDGTQVSLHCRQTLLPSEPPGTGHRMSQNKMPQCEGARDTCSGLTAPCVWVGKTHTAANVPLSPWGRGAPRRHQTGVDLSAMEGTPPPHCPHFPHHGPQSDTSQLGCGKPARTPLSGREEAGIAQPRDAQSCAGRDAQEKRAQIRPGQGVLMPPTERGALKSSSSRNARGLSPSHAHPETNSVTGHPSK